MSNHINRKTNKKHLAQTVKFVLAALFSILTAQIAGLEYAVTAGIITILSIQGTKRETFITAKNRALAFITALVIAKLCFGLIGFSVAGFAVYLFAFILLCLYMGWPEAIVMDSVLISHFLAEGEMSASWIVNETGLFIVGATWGILFNLHLHKSENEFAYLSGEVDESIRCILGRMAGKLGGNEKSEYYEEQFADLELKISAAKECALRNWNNTLINSSADELEYIRMRENQSRVLQNLQKSIVMVESVQRQIPVVVGFLEKIVDEYDRNNDCGELLKRLERIFEEMKSEPMPGSRTEFETRAVLYYILKQLEEFLMLKHRYTINKRA